MRRAQLIPIECDAYARLIWCDDKRVFYHQRTCGVFVYRKAVNLDQTRVGLCGDKTDVQFLHTMATGGQAMFAAELCHLKPTCDTTAILGVGLDIGQLRILAGIFEFMQGMEIFAHRQRYTSVARDLAVPFIIIRDCWFFEPE